MKEKSQKPMRPKYKPGDMVWYSFYDSKTFEPRYERALVFKVEKVSTPTVTSFVQEEYTQPEWPEKDLSYEWPKRVQTKNQQHTLGVASEGWYGVADNGFYGGEWTDSTKNFEEAPEFTQTNYNNTPSSCVRRKSLYATPTTTYQTKMVFVEEFLYHILCDEKILKVRGQDIWKRKRDFFRARNPEPFLNTLSTVFSNSPGLSTFGVPEYKQMEIPYDIADYTDYTTSYSYSSQCKRSK